jgi:hypothetical protein
MLNLQKATIVASFVAYLLLYAATAGATVAIH